MEYKVVASAILYPEKVETKSGYKILDTYKNLQWLLKHFYADIRYNLMTRRREITFPEQYVFPDDVENSALSRVNYLATINDLPTKQLDNHLDTIASENPYHPIVECIKANPWDGTERLDDFVATLEVKNPDLATKIIKTWMVSAIAAAHSINGFINQGVLVLQGPQGIGKTHWVKALDPIGCSAVKEGCFLDPGQKDSILQLASYWIVELGELEAIFKRSEIGRLKSFITMEFDYVRLPYAHRATRLARRTAYVATVNDANFLSDDTGNRRWWTVEVVSINYKHGLDMKQIWSEAFDLWQKGALTYLEKDIQSEVNDSNLEHEKIDPLKEKVLTWYDWTRPGRKWLSATAVLEEIGYRNPNRSDSTRMGAVLKEINGKEGRKSHGVKLHEVPVTPVFRNQGNLVE